MFRMKHIPTGLYYGPVTGKYKGQTTHLKKVGKIYGNYPDTNYLTYVCINNAQIKKYPHVKTKETSCNITLIYNSEDWVIEEMEYKVIKEHKIYE